MKLRGHHLICLHFFKGKRYDKKFQENLSNLLKGIDKKEITITYSADDVCKKCQHLRNGLCSYEENAKEEIKEMDRKALKLLGISQKTARWKEIKEKLPEIFNEWFTYCKKCDWKDDCMENNEWTGLARGLLNN